MQQALITDPLAYETAQRTEELWDRRGWALWICDALDGDTIAVVRDLDVALPRGVLSRVHAVYYDSELQWIAEHNDGPLLTQMRRLRTWHGLKKAAHPERLIISEIEAGVAAGSK